MSTRDAREEEPLRQVMKDVRRLDEGAPLPGEPWLTGPEDVERRLQEALAGSVPSWEEISRAARERETRRARR